MKIAPKFAAVLLNALPLAVLAAPYDGSSETYALNITVLASQGTANVEDPWIGFEGGPFDNIHKMMHGEASFGGARGTFKNAHQGAHVFVRDLNPVAAPVSERATFGMLAPGDLVVAAVALRRRPS